MVEGALIKLFNPPPEKYRGDCLPWEALELMDNQLYWLVSHSYDFPKNIHKQSIKQLLTQSYHLLKIVSRGAPCNQKWVDHDLKEIAKMIEDGRKLHEPVHAMLAIYRHFDACAEEHNQKTRQKILQERTKRMRTIPEVDEILDCSSSEESDPKPCPTPSFNEERALGEWTIECDEWLKKWDL